MASSTPGKGRRRKYTSTPAERAAAKQRDRSLRAQAAADMADPEVIARRIRQVLGEGMPARLRTYSLRNLLLILRQAEERNLTLTDIDTRNGWIRRGRIPAQPGLRIVRPVDDDNTPAAADTDTNADDFDDAGEGEEGARPGFRMAPRWDISQTVALTSGQPADDEQAQCPGCDAGPGEPCRRCCNCAACTGDTAPHTPDVIPADVVWNCLQDQITRAGYRFDWPAQAETLHGAKVRADHHAHTVHVDMWATAGDPDALTAIAAALGEIITRRDAERAERRAIAAAPNA
jgi:hypothetical protein